VLHLAHTQRKEVRLWPEIKAKAANYCNLDSSATQPCMASHILEEGQDQSRVEAMCVRDPTGAESPSSRRLRENHRIKSAGHIWTRRTERRCEERCVSPGLQLNRTSANRDLRYYSTPGTRPSGSPG